MLTEKYLDVAGERSTLYKPNQTKILKACWAENSVITKLLQICVQWAEFNFVLTDRKCCQQLNDGL